MAKTQDNSAESEEKLAFTPDKQRVYQEYLRTGYIDGEKIDNTFAVARKLGTSISRINAWHIEQEKKSSQEKEDALHELEVLQRKTQNTLLVLIVRIALMLIIGTGSITTILFIIAMVFHYDITIIQSVWANTLGIIITNCFSIVGTIMGVKYTQEKDKQS